jgi:hypothetical protein
MINCFNFFISLIGLVIVNVICYLESLSSTNGPDFMSLTSLIIGVILVLSCALLFIVMISVVNGKLNNNKKHKIQIE